MQAYRSYQMDNYATWHRSVFTVFTEITSNLSDIMQYNIIIYNIISIRYNILEHPNIKAFITHGGYLSTLEAMIHSVPMIGIPLFGDQFENINNYVDKNVAVKLDISKITEKDMDTALNAILYDPRYR